MFVKVFFVTAECWPFAKTGGLGDVAYALPKALKKEGIDARVIMPKYANIPNYLKEKMEEVAIFNVNVGWRNQYCGLYKLEHDGIIFYFIDNEYYFKREGPYTYLYGYGDDAERFTFFCNAVLETISRIDFYPDVMHCNDWHTGIIPALLNEHYRHRTGFENIKTVFTIHNLQYQGVFPRKVLSDVLSLPNWYLDEEYLEFYGGVNFMKSGIVFSDVITTVSPTYVEEIQTEYYGEGLQGLLKQHSYKLKGILNGIDYDIFNPLTDENIYINYDFETIRNKSKNKIELQKIMALEVDEDIPLIGVVSRLVSQKGMDLISYMMPEIIGKKLQLVVLGTGDERYESMFNYHSWNYPDKVASRIMFDSALAQKIYAGSDMFLMPSLFEPCGIGQMLAMRYGTLPIVRETGGLKDTVNPYNQYTGEGNGFSFENYNAHEMFDAIQRAIEIYNDKKKWNDVVKNAMNKDNSWEKSAREYIELYENIKSN
jgi:starch synthase